jgi:hypothetical protein
MCDKCGDLFSENSEDWSTFSGTVKRKREDGSRYTETLSQDACPACTTGTTAPATPSLPRPSLPPGRPDYAKIAELEAENGIPPMPGTAG